MKQNVNAVCEAASQTFVPTRKKKKYKPLSILPISINMEGAVMVGSVVDQKIKVNKTVEVEEYSYGFHDDSFNDVGFDVNFE